MRRVYLPLCLIGAHLALLRTHLLQVAVKQILKNLNLWKCKSTKHLPWQTSANDRRCNEFVRPIFWSTRPKSYLMVRPNHPPPPPPSRRLLE